MNPPSDDIKGPTPLPGQPGAGAGKVDPAKSDPTKIEPTKIDAAKPEPAKTDVDQPKVDALKADAIKPGEPSKPDPMKSAAPQPEPAKVDVVKASPLKADPAKPEPAKSEPPKSGGFGAGSQYPSPKPPVTDGPIIDLKAKRLPDPVDMAKAAGKPSEARPADAKPTDSKPADAKTSAPLTDKPGAASGEAAKPLGSTTPKVALGASGASPQAAPARGGPGFGSVAAAGLLGGVIGAGLLFAVERTGALDGALGGGETTRMAALDQRIAALAPKDALAALDKRVGSNEAALKPLSDAVRGAEAAAKEAIQKAGATPAAAIDGAAPAAAVALPPDILARLDGLDQRVAALQEEPARDQSSDAKTTIQSGPNPARLASFDERLKALEGKAPDGKPDGAGKSGAPSDLGPKLAALQGDVESRTKASAEASQALAQKVAALQQALDTRVQAATEAVQAAATASQQTADAGKAQAAEAAKAVERQLQAQSDKIAGLDKAVAARAETGTVQAALRVVSADRIATALGVGSPYADALAALRSMEPGDPANLTAVAVFADKGAPTARSLATEFRAIAERIAASRKAAQARSVAATGDLSQRLMSMAESIVQVRKVDGPAPAEGASVSDPVPKVQDALDRGALAEAAKAFAALPEDAKSQAGDFGAKLTSRASAGEAAQALLSDAFKALPATGASR